MTPYTIRPLTAADQGWVADFMTEHWGAPLQVVRGETFFPHTLPGFVAEVAGQVAGLVTYRQLDAQTGEVATLNSLREGMGIGGALVQAVAEAIRTAGCTRLVVVTTNDNFHALRFYQRHGFVLAALRPNALARARQIKPEIPLVGMDGIPLRDEIELEMTLESRDE